MAQTALDGTYREAHLSKVLFPASSLRYSDFSHSNLSEVVFSKADLTA